MNILFALLASVSSFSADFDYVVMEPSKVECRVIPGTERGSMACNIYYGGKIVHEGRNMSEAIANGDCVKCETVLNDATSLGKRVRMYRGYFGSDLADWHMQNFFVVDQPEYCRK